VLLVAAACGAPDDDVKVTLEHSRFALDRTEFRPGETVTFVIVNDDPIDHEFILGDEEVQDVHESGTGHHHGEVPGEISVPAGETRTATFTFPVALGGSDGTLIVGCHLPGHYAYGMRAEVRVTG